MLIQLFMKNSLYFICALAIFISLLIACVKSESTQNEITPVVDKTVSPETTSVSDISIPDGWVLFPTPKENSAEIRCANRAENEQKVENDNGKVKFSKYVYLEDEQLSKLPAKLKEQILKNRNIGKGLGGYLHVESFNNGWLIGSDAGEWGGQLTWFSENGNQKIELLKDNIRGIVKIGDEVFVLSGMAHEFINEGKIYKLVKDENGSLKSLLLTDLKTQPQTFVVETDESVLIVLNNKIIRLKISGDIETLKNVNFAMLYPSSAGITSAGIIYVGMRLFVVRFVPKENSYTEEWLVPQNCQKFAEKDFDCVCQNEKIKAVQ